MITDTLLQRLRSHLASPGVSKSGLAKAAGLHPNSLRDADREDWNPTLATLRALELHLPGLPALPAPAADADPLVEPLQPEAGPEAPACLPFPRTSSGTSPGPGECGSSPLPSSTSSAAEAA
jgi:hypothetical protein